MHYTRAMTVLAGLLDQLDLGEEELADAMREATARTSQGGVGPVSAGMTDFLARTTPRGRSRSTARSRLFLSSRRRRVFRGNHFGCNIYMP